MLDPDLARAEADATRAAPARGPSSPLRLNGMWPPQSDPGRPPVAPQPAHVRDAAAEGLAGSGSSAPGPNAPRPAARTASRSMPRSRSAEPSSWRPPEGPADDLGVQPRRPGSARASASCGRPAVRVPQHGEQQVLGADPAWPSARASAWAPTTAARAESVKRSNISVLRGARPQPGVLLVDGCLLTPSRAPIASQDQPWARALRTWSASSWSARPQRRDGAQPDGRVLAGGLLGDTSRCSGHAGQRTLTRRGCQPPLTTESTT